MTLRANIMDTLVPLLKQLVAIPSMHTRPEDIRACADFIAAWLTTEAIPHRRLEFEGTPSILVLPDGRATGVLLMSHMDVVDAPEELFHPVVRDGRLYGRGSVDDKYAVALSLILLREHLARGTGFETLPFGVLITGDEEVGGRNGARKALEHIRADFAIALDGGSLGCIVVKEKGLLRLKLHATGRSAHGARPWLGDNAIHTLMADLAAIQELFPLGHDPTYWHRTLNIGRLAAGEAVNRVPDTAEAWLDIRYTENDDPQALVADLESRIRGQLEVQTVDPLFIGGGSPYLERLLACSPDTRTGSEHGASDARHLSAVGIPGVVWGADGENSQHTHDEHVVLDSVADLLQRLDRFFYGLPLGLPKQV
jgi:succinyl-diaminopimelate desuccinylase